jgi:hypothetical protein
MRATVGRTRIALLSDEDAGLTGHSRIAITYGQPHARARKIEAGLIPLDAVWRFGANAATTLHTDVDVTIGSPIVPHATTRSICSTASRAGSSS